MKQHDQQDRASSVWLEAIATDETRDADGNLTTMRVRGYAVVFDSPSERMGSVVETIDKRAFDHLGDLNALGVRMQVNHGGIAVASTDNDTLRISKDAKGLQIEADLDPRRPDARSLYYAVERGDVGKMSFGFRVAPGGESVRELPDGSLRVHVTKVDALREVSGVDYPAYRDTDLSAVLADASDEDEPSEEARGWDPDTLRRAADLERWAA